MHLLGRAISDFSLNLNKNLDLSKLGGSGFPLLLKNSRPCQQLDLTSRHLAGPCPQLMMSLVNLGKLGCTSSPDLLKNCNSVKDVHPVLRINDHATGGRRTKDILGGPKGWGPKKKVANIEIYVIFEVFAFCGRRTKTDFKDRA